MANKICTSFEQSKRLIELGIDIDTADLTVTNLPLEGGERFDYICMRLPSDTFPSITDGKSEKIPAWSLSALLGLIPKPLLGQHLESEYWECTTWEDFNVVKEVYGQDNPLDTTFEIVCWLLENDKL